MKIETKRTDLKGHHRFKGAKCHFRLRPNEYCFCRASYLLVHYVDDKRVDHDFVCKRHQLMARSRFRKMTRDNSTPLGQLINALAKSKKKRLLLYREEGNEVPAQQQASPKRSSSLSHLQQFQFGRRSNGN